MYFSGQPVQPSRRAEVARALDGCLKSRDVWVGYDTCEALKNWGDKDSVRPLVQFYFDVPDGVIRPRTIDALGHIQDPASAKALVELARSRQADLGQVAQALRHVGKVGEKEVTALLDEGDENLAVAGCQVLAAVGTRASLPALETLKEKNAPAVGARQTRRYREASNAISAIKLRGA
jgi:hypothetical protein